MGAASIAAAAPQQKLNFVLILMDDLGWADLRATAVSSIRLRISIEWRLAAFGSRMRMPRARCARHRAQR